jgi:mono/diheme cytochrome c family protein
MRVWKSKSGNYQVRAEMISADTESVKLATEDGRQITVALEKLSQADRDYVLAHATDARESTASDDAESGDATSDDSEKKIKLVIAQFYLAVAGDGDAIRAFLTQQGQASYDRSPTFYQDVRGADRGRRPLVTKVTINEEENTATADYRLRLAGKNFSMQMLLTLQNDQWRVSGIIGPGPGDTKNKMDFDNARATTGGTDLSTTQDDTTTAQSATTDLLARGADAYAVGFCAKCHGEQGTGTRRGPDLTDDQWDHCDGSTNGIRQVLVAGVPKSQLVDRSRPHAMNPATNRVEEAELDALAEFVKSLGSQAE